MNPLSNIHKLDVGHTIESFSGLGHERPFHQLVQQLNNPNKIDQLFAFQLAETLCSATRGNASIDDRDYAFRFKIFKEMSIQFSREDEVRILQQNIGTDEPNLFIFVINYEGYLRDQKEAQRNANSSICTIL